MSRYNLRDIREDRGISQPAIAKKMDKSQPEVSRLERRDRFYIDTLRDYIEATGGRLRIYAEYDDSSIQVIQVDDDTDES